MSVVFTVMFDGQFWVGVLEVREHGSIRAARHVFGAEPTAADLATFCCGREGDALLDLAHAAPPLAIGTREPSAPKSPKRLARAAAREMRVPKRSTQAQEALRPARDAQARESKGATRRATEQARAEERAKRLARRKARHRGR